MAIPLGRRVLSRSSESTAGEVWLCERAAIARRSIEKPNEARIDFADRADELHDAFGLAFPAFRRFENLPHAPAHVGFDSFLEECLPRELRIEIGQSGAGWNQREAESASAAVCHGRARRPLRRLRRNLCGRGR